jgi:hypothetical protein
MLIVPSKITFYPIRIKPKEVTIEEYYNNIKSKKK